MTRDQLDREVAAMRLKLEAELELEAETLRSTHERELQALQQPVPLTHRDIKQLRAWLNQDALQANCGTGDGGFQPGNSCSGGGGGKGGGGGFLRRAKVLGIGALSQVALSTASVAALTLIVTSKLSPRAKAAASAAVMTVSGVLATHATSKTLRDTVQGSADPGVELQLLRLAIAESKDLDQTDRDEIEEWLHSINASLLTANCGTGDGGFQPGNSCAGGGGGKGGGKSGGGSFLRRAKAFGVHGFKQAAYSIAAGEAYSLISKSGLNESQRLLAVAAVATVTAALRLRAAGKLAVDVIKGSAEPALSPTQLLRFAIAESKDMDEIDQTEITRWVDSLNASLAACALPTQSLDGRQVLVWIRDALKSGGVTHTQRQPILQHVAETLQTRFDDLEACGLRALSRDELVRQLAEVLQFRDDFAEVLRTVAGVIDMDEHIARHPELQANCGNGAGGFRPGNKCARGSSGGGGGASLVDKTRRKLRNDVKHVGRAVEKTVVTTKRSVNDVVNSVKGTGESWGKSVRQIAQSMADAGKAWAPAASRLALTATVLSPIPIEDKAIITFVLAKAISAEARPNSPLALIDWII